MSTGITGDVCQKLASQAREMVANDPGSIYAYALWRTSLDLSRHFDDDQGIDMDVADTINALVLPPLERFLEADGLSIETAHTRSLLSQLLQGMWELRTAMSLF